MCVRATHKKTKFTDLYQMTTASHTERISRFTEISQSRENHPKEKGNQFNRKISTEENNLIGRYPLKKTNLIERHLPKETESIGKET